MPDEILITAENIGKKFCRSLKRSLWYGVKDIARDINPFSGNSQPPTDNPQLRPDEFWALQDISFQLKRGECLGLIGHNGAGKSTLLKVLNGLIVPDTGRLTIRGKVGSLIELSAGFNPILSGKENIYNRGALLGFSRKAIDEKFDAIVDFAELDEFIDMPVQNYSSGMQVRLGFAVSSQLEPDILILDEVLAVGDVAFQHKCINAMGKILQNAAVIFVSHSMPSVFRISTEALVLDHGRNIYQGDVGKAIEHYHSAQKSAGESIAGSGEVRVKSCRLKNSGAENESEVDPDLPFQIMLELEADESISNARVQAVIWNQQMMPVADLVGSDRIGYLTQFSGSSNSASLSVTANHLPLNAGRYTMSICTSSEKGERVYCRHDNAAVFHVSRANTSGAHFVVPSSWDPIETSPSIPS